MFNELLKKLTVRKLAFIYAGIFFFTVIIGYIPFLNPHGQLLGMFDIDPIDDVLHLASAAWALLAGWYSVGWTLFYFRVFGILYCLDGLMGLLLGFTYLDLGFLGYEGHNGIPVFTERIFTNLPHVAAGGFAVYVGFVLYKQITK